MEVRDSRERGQRIVDFRVVLHRAAAEREEPGVDAEVPLGQPREVAGHLGFGELGKALDRVPDLIRSERLSRIDGGDSGWIERVTRTPRARALEQERLCQD